jgi:hypothetical protein
MKRWALAVVVLAGAGAGWLVYSFGKPKKDLQRIGGAAKSALAKIHGLDLAGTAYELWRRDHPDGVCPERIEELIRYAQGKDTKDPWGTEYVIKCDGLPEGTELGVVSAGPDKTLGTEDDIRSWDLPPKRR